MAYSVPNLNPSSATYPQIINDGSTGVSAVERNNSRTASVGAATAAEDAKAYYSAIFDGYENVQNNLLKRLNSVFGSTVAFDAERHVIFTDFIKDVCTDSEQANDAYKFYGRQIIEQINQLGDYILKARDILQQIEAKSPLNYYLDRLNILSGFCKTIEDAFGIHAVYDLNEDVWRTYEDDYRNAWWTTQMEPSFFSKLTYEKLRNMRVKAYQRADGDFTKKNIEVFNELNLFDRLQYIKLYYDIADGKSDAVFPNDKVNGIPTVKEASKTDVIAAIEPFFMGYLIDRDGPVNAAASYLEVKSAALVEKIRLESEKIKALNVYLKFIQRALDMLNSSQDGWEEGEYIHFDRHQIPDGAMIGLMYLCGGNMYALAEAADGRKCLVIESYDNRGQYLLVSADDAGMNLLIGDRADARDHTGNDCAGTRKHDDGYWHIANFSFSASPDKYHYSKEPAGTDHHKDTATDFGKTFVLPSQIDCDKISPKSVRCYDGFNNKFIVAEDTYSSWRKAFQDKISFVQTAMETVNTDIKVFRNKVDTLNTLSNTFRNRTHTAYMKVASNLKK